MTARMTLFLASVRDPVEAECAIAAGADIIDLKEPTSGALGAVPLETCVAVLEAVRGRARTSATIGDIPLQPQALAAAVRERAALGIDYVKAGLFRGGDPDGALAALAPLTAGSGLILVAFADRAPGFDAVAAAASIGAAGVMLDTAGKGSGSLTDHLRLVDIERFVLSARRLGLMVGLAGSLRAEHVPILLPLAPDILGFRGALCHGGRNGRLDREACRAIRALIPENAAKACPGTGAFNLSGEEALC